MADETSHLLLSQARAASQREEHDRALVFFRRAHEADPRSVEALVGVARAAAQLWRDDVACAAYLELAELYIRTGKLGPAADAVKSVLELEPKEPLALRFDEFLRGRLQPEIEIGPSSVARHEHSPADGFEDAPTHVVTGSEVAAGASKAPRREEFGAVGTRAAPPDVVAELRLKSQDDQFADIPTIPASETLMAALAGATEGTFSAITTVGDVQKLANAALEDLGEWDAATTVAIAAANVLVKPRATGTWEFDEKDFPSLDENDFAAPARTIMLAGDGVVLAFAELVRQSPLLKPLGPARCQSLLAGSDVVQCFAGQVILEQGAKGSGLHLVVTGQVALERKTSEGTHRIATAWPGDFFGECSLLGGTPNSMTARVTEDALLLEIGVDLIKELVASEPELLTVLSRALRTRLLAALWQESSMLRTLSALEQRDLAASVHLHRARPSDLIVVSGSVPTGLWTVMAGELERHGPGGAVRLGRASAVGLSSCRGGTASATVSATTPCWLLLLPAENFRELCRRHPELIGRAEA